jgi:hypothetical protein
MTYLALISGVSLVLLAYPIYYYSILPEGFAGLILLCGVLLCFLSPMEMLDSNREKKLRKLEGI